MYELLDQADIKPYPNAKSNNTNPNPYPNPNPNPNPEQNAAVINPPIQN